MSITLIGARDILVNKTNSALMVLMVWKARVTLNNNYSYYCVTTIITRAVNGKCRCFRSNKCSVWRWITYSEESENAAPGK